MTLYKLFWKLTKEKFTLMKLILEEQQKYLQSFNHNATYRPMNPDTDVTYKTVNLFSSDKCFIYFISHSMKSAQQCLYNSGKGRYTGDMRRDDMFILWNRISAIFIKIENAVYTSFQKSTILFINGLISDIMNIQNNQSLEFEWPPMLAQHRSVNDRRFSWLHVFLSFF